MFLCMKVILSFLCLISATLFAQAQGEATRSVFVEVGGASLVYSFNYDVRFDKENLNSWGIRMGIGGYSLSDESLLTVPVQATRLFGQGRNYFDVGAGITLINYRNTYTSYDYSNWDPNSGEYPILGEVTEKDYHFILEMGETPSVVGTLNFGYRRIPENGGFTYRVNVTPLFNSHGFWPLFAGIGLGYAF